MLSNPPQCAIANANPPLLFYEIWAITVVSPFIFWAICATVANPFGKKRVGNSKQTQSSRLFVYLGNQNETKFGQKSF